GPIHDRRVGVEARLAARAAQQPARDPGELMAGPESSVRIGLGEIAAVQRPGQFVEGVNVLENVDLPSPRPVARTEHPKGRPVAQAGGGIGLPNGRSDGHLPTGRRAEVTADRLDPPGRPRLVRTECRDVEIPVAVQVNVARRVSHGFDLAGTEDACPGVVLPYRRVDSAAGGTI